MHQQIDTESLESRVQRLMDAHNNLATRFQTFAGGARLLLDSLTLLLEKEIEDFDAKYDKANLVCRIEQTVQARLTSHAIGDLKAFAKFGKNLEALKKEAKEKKLQSLYNKTIRRIEKTVDKIKYGEPKADFSFEELMNMPDAELVEVKRKPPDG